MKLIPNWNKAWKFSSVHMSLIGLLINLLDYVNQTWISLPDEIQSMFPYRNKITVTLFILVMVCRIIDFKGDKNVS